MGHENFDLQTADPSLFAPVLIVQLTLILFLMNLQVLVADINIGYEDIVNIQVIMTSITITFSFLGPICNCKVNVSKTRDYLVSVVLATHGYAQWRIQEKNCRRG